MKWHCLFRLAVGCLTIGLISVFPAESSGKGVKWQCALGPTVPGSAYQWYQEKEIPRRVKEVTKGEVEIIPHRELVKASDILDAVRDRRVDMGVQGTMYRGDTTLFNYLSLPVILPFEALPEMHMKVLPIFEEALRQDFGVEMLGFGYWPRQLLISKRPAATFEELKGLKFRTHSYEILQLMKDVGGAPVSMPYMEVYLAMQRGAIDGAVSSMAGFKGQKWYEVAKNVNWWPLGNTGYLLIVNKDSWSELPADMQKRVRETVIQAGIETWEKADKEDETMKKEFEEQFGCTHYYPPKAEIAELAKMMKPIVEDWKKRAGKRGSEVMAIVNQALGTNY